MRAKLTRLLYVMVGLAFASAACLALVVWLQSRQSPERLVVSWEGAVKELNVRDMGKSLNECLGKPTFAEGRAFRSDRWFSGWSCEQVGSPDVILSLNYRPDKNERFYCRQDGRNLIGRVSHGEKELSGLEFAETWDDRAMRESACWYFREGLKDLAEGKRMLFHCDAGRDRTGTYAAVLAALAAEEAGKLDDAMIDAIECDYRKSKSLTQAKYGRMRDFIGVMQSRGGVAHFLETQCGIDSAASKAAALALWQGGGI